MNIITPESKAKGIAERWKEQYYRPSASRWIDHGRDRADKETKYYKLLKLGENPTPAEIAEVIGNSIWTNTFCGFCDAEGIPVAEIHQGTCQYDDPSIYVCKPCTKAIGKAFNKV